jgi:hypothetical protein
MPSVRNEIDLKARNSKDLASYMKSGFVAIGIGIDSEITDIQAYIEE